MPLCKAITASTNQPCSRQAVDGQGGLCTQHWKIALRGVAASAAAAAAASTVRMCAAAVDGRQCKNRAAVGCAWCGLHSKQVTNGIPVDRFVPAGAARPSASASAAPSASRATGSLGGYLCAPSSSLPKPAATSAALRLAAAAPQPVARTAAPRPAAAAAPRPAAAAAPRRPAAVAAPRPAAAAAPRPAVNESPMTDGTRMLIEWTTGSTLRCHGKQHNGKQCSNTAKNAALHRCGLTHPAYPV
jgi:hypothetical protein